MPLGRGSVTTRVPVAVSIRKQDCPYQVTSRPRGAGSVEPAVPGAGVVIEPAVPSVRAGLPALVLPCGFAANLPVALQLVGVPFSENALLAVGREFQTRTDWHKRRPKV